MTVRQVVRTIAATLWLAPVAVMGGLYEFAPDMVTREGNAGTFVSATASPGGFFSPDMTSIQTTQGTLVVGGAVSAQRGQVLVVRDTTGNGLQVCTIELPATCMSLVGQYAGQLASIRRPPISYDTRVTLGSTAGVWFLFGAFFFMLVCVGTGDETVRVVSESRTNINERGGLGRK